MAAETGLITKDDLAEAREIEFVEEFGYSVQKLLDALGVTRQIPKQAGTVLKTYKATGELQPGSVAEGDTIPLSEYKVEAVDYKEITLNKWRKATSAEAIIDRGYDQAVSKTTDEMLKDVQRGIRKDFFDFLKDEDGKTETSGDTFQATLANVWGELQVLFDDDNVDAVYFINPLDAAAYLGTEQVGMQTAFGMSYIEDFLGLGSVFMNSNVEQGTVYGTARDNIVLYYVPVNGADLNNAFEFTSDTTGYIGIHETPDYTNMTASDTVVNGMALFAEMVDGIVVGTIAGE